MRRLPPQPLSNRAVWALRCAWFAAAVAAMGLLAMRFTVLPFRQSVVVLGAGAAVALLALLLAGLALREVWNIGARGFSKAFGGLLLSGSLLAAPVALAVQAARTPALRDVTTDLDNLPAFSRAQAARAARGGVVPADSGAGQRALQRRSYPDLKPVILDMPIDEAMAVVNGTIEAMGWQVIARQNPSSRGGPARIDAVETSLVVRLPDDITVRVTPLIDRTRVDIRSASRFGDRDFGSNARRIRAFISELQQEARAR